jgi:hypothetical protein
MEYIVGPTYVNLDCCANVSSWDGMDQATSISHPTWQGLRTCDIKTEVINVCHVQNQRHNIMTLTP